MKIRNEAQAYNFIEKEFEIADKSENLINNLLDRFRTRFNIDFMNLEWFQKKECYDSTIVAVKSLFNGLSFDEKLELASSLVELIKNEYCSCEFGVVNHWFLAAVLHICFELLKECEERFRIAFCSFNINNGSNEAFCRLVVVSKIEVYCRFVCNETRPWHRDVFRFDGEVIKKNKYIKSDEKILKYLWMNKWCVANDDNGIKLNKQRGLKALMMLLGNDNKSKIESAYWLSRCKSN